MAELLYGRYVPVEVVVVKKDETKYRNFIREGYIVQDVCPYNLYLLTKPAKLELIFRKGEADFIFNMIEDAYRYYGKQKISEEEAWKYIVQLASGKIKISILPNGSYTLK